MKFVVATFLVIISMATAEPPRFGSFARQTSPQSAPYAPSGFRPQGAQFTLPERQRALPQQNYGAPPASYGPPQQYGPPEFTTELPTTTDSTTEEFLTEEPQAESFKVSADKRKPTKLQEQPEKQQQAGGAYYFVLPQSQNLVYAVQQSAPLVAVPQTNVFTAARLQTVPVTSSAVYSPYSSASLVQIYQ